MNTLTAIIVDDEPLALKLLRSKLDSFANVKVVGECKNGRQAIDMIMDLTPDLVFLDIQMPGLNGFDVVKNLQSDLLPLIVFTTAYEQYALDAFDVHAVDYILKPIDKERIERAIERAFERMAVSDLPDNKPRIIGAINAINMRESSGDNLSENFAQSQFAANSIERKVVIRERDEITLLKQADIQWIDAAGDYVCLHADGETHIKRSTLKELLEELDDTIFKRVHRSTIVNLNFIEKVIPHTKGEFFLQLGEYDRIKVSRNYKEAIKAYLTER
ncbi:response regulator transcription factor [Aliiglaciecola sp. LCG003]|uniref:LytR/AlgR family response regulator transcription factor n=1 Tax=Aliiglaciecola sp. LCG003 TaxID=3053655 RepID=UPI002572F5C0|nr:response regulator transcription factor [Aliiglaciecola sp. LCG003]WJG10134.1 response regulator transcription factor [Aliiglaciecola sp. LCG003]